MDKDKQRIAIAEVFIPLTQGFVTVIDWEDRDKVAPFKWRVRRNGRTNYAISDTGGERIQMHHIILGYKHRVDHIDDDGLNNKRLNLRPISHTNNIRRKRANLNGTSKYKGVSLTAATGKWQASIKVNGKSLYLGYYFDEIEAAKAYDVAALKHFGEFSRINFP